MILPETKELIDIIVKKLEPSGWEQALRMFLYGSEMEQIIEELKYLRSIGKRFVPSLGEAFRFLEECLFDNIKMVFLIDCDRLYMRQNTGIPLMNEGGYEDRILRNVLRSMGSVEIGKDNWSNQGMLMLPISPTHVLDTRGMAKEWMPFVTYIIDKMNEYYPDIPWVVTGKNITPYKILIKSKSVFTTSLWDNEEIDTCWGEVNEIIESQNKKRIIW